MGFAIVKLANLGQKLQNSFGILLLKWPLKFAQSCGKFLGFLLLSNTFKNHFQKLI